MPLNPTGSEIPRSLTEIGTTIDVALDSKADFVRITDNPSTTTAASSYAITGTLEFDGTPITGPASLDFVSTNLWQGDSSSLSIESGKWRLIFGGLSVQGSWLSVQTTSTRPENCTWIEEEDVSGAPILTFTRATVATTGQFALVDDGVYDPVMWQNLGTDVAQEWVPLTTATALSAHTSATGNVHGLSAANVRSILGVSTLSGSNTGDQNLAPYATTSAVAAGYQPLDSDLTAIAALTTTSTGRSLLTESTAQTGTGALVRAASPTLTGTLTAAAITASGTITGSGTVVVPYTATGTERYVNSAFANFNRQFGMYVEASGNEGGFKADSTFTLKGSTILVVTGSAITSIGANGSNSRITSVQTGILELGATGHTVQVNGPATCTNLTASGTVSALHFEASSAADIRLVLRASDSVVLVMNKAESGFRQFQAGNITAWGSLSLSGDASITRIGANHIGVTNLTASGTLRVGGGTVVANILSATATLDFPSIGSNDTETLTITVTGAVAGDSVFLGCPAGLDAGLVFCASVTAANTVTVRMHNSSGGSVDPASGTFRATVIRF